MPLYILLTAYKFEGPRKLADGDKAVTDVDEMRLLKNADEHGPIILLTEISLTILPETFTYFLCGK